MCSEKRRVIFHIDVNSAFLSWEAVYRLRHLGGTVDLRQETAAVGEISASAMGLFWQSPFPLKNMLYVYLLKPCGNVPICCWFRPTTDYISAVPRHFSAFFGNILRQWSSFH